MAKNSAASSEALKAGIVVTVSRLAKVSAQMSLVEPRRRAEQLLVKAEAGSGEYKFVIQQYFPVVPDTHPWVKIEKYPDSNTSYLLLLRHEKNAFKGEFRVPPHRAGKEFLEAMTEAASEICAKGWFPKKEVTSPPAPETAPPIVKTITGWIGRNPRRLVDQAKIEPKPVSPPTVAMATPPVVTPAPAPAPAAPKSPPTFGEAVATWLIETAALIDQNEQRIAELNEAMGREMEAICLKYTGLTDGLRTEIKDLKRMRRQFSNGGTMPPEELSVTVTPSKAADDEPISAPLTTCGSTELDWFVRDMMP